MSNKKKILLGSALGLAAAATIGVTSSYAFGNRGNFSQEQHEQVTKALESNDYNAWKELMGDREIARKITQENFSKFIQMHNLMAEADKIREELGIKKQMRHRNENRGENREEIEKALEEGDYEAWKKLKTGKRVLEVIDSEEKFNQLVQSHKLMEEGKYEEAKQIREELGVGMGKGSGRRGSF